MLCTCAKKSMNRVRIHTCIVTRFTSIKINLCIIFDSFECVMSNKNPQLIFLGSETRESAEHTYIHLSGIYSRMLRTLFRKSTFIIKFLELNKSQRNFNSTLKSIYKKNQIPAYISIPLQLIFNRLFHHWTFKQKIQINKFSYFSDLFFLLSFSSSPYYFVCILSSIFF